MDLSKQIWQLFKANRYLTARRILVRELSDDPTSHWLLFQIGLTYYERFEYKDSLVVFRYAHKLMPQCPLVIWNLAGALRMLDRDEEAIDLYRKIIRRGANRIANGPCGEGIRRATSLVNDTKKRLAELVG